MKLVRLFDGILLSFAFVLAISVSVLGAQWVFVNFDKILGIQNEEILLGSISIIVEEPGPDISSQAVISVWTDLSSSKVYFAKNEDRKLIIASITKLMTAVIVLENIKLSEKIEISKEAQSLGGDGELLKAGEIYFAKDLLYAMIIGSDNAAAHALSERLGLDSFVSLMNEKAEELELADTFFSNATGLGLENFSTAQDLAKLAEYILKRYNSLFDISVIKEFDLYSADGKILHKIINTDQLLKDSSDSEEIVGGKTGQTRTSGQCLLLVLSSADNKSFLINVILNSEDRFGEMKKLINWANDTFNF